MAKLVADTYGDAFFMLAVETNQVDKLLNEVKAASDALKENSNFTKLMNHPKIAKEEKRKILETIFKGRISDELLGLMQMLFVKNHFNEMENVFAHFVKKVKEYKNIGTVYVTSPTPLREEQKGMLLEKLKKTTKYEIFEIHYAVDSSLIGGMIIRIGDRVVDNSIQTKLRKLTRELSKIQLKVGEGIS